MRTTTNSDTLGQTRETHQFKRTHTQILRASNVDNVHHLTQKLECLFASYVRIHTQLIDQLQTRNYARAPPPTL